MLLWKHLGLMALFLFYFLKFMGSSLTLLLLWRQVYLNFQLISQGVINFFCYIYLIALYKTVFHDTSKFPFGFPMCFARALSHICTSLSYLGFPGSSAGKESTCNAGDLGPFLGLGRSPGEGNSYPLQYSGLENSRDCIVHGVAKSWTQLSDFHFHALPSEPPGQPVFLWTM